MLDDCLWTYKLTGRDPALILELRAAGKIEELLRVAQMFEVELPIARIDIYWYKGRFYGGEVTLTSGAFAQHCISASCARTALGSDNVGRAGAFKFKCSEGGEHPRLPAPLSPALPPAQPLAWPLA